MVARFTALKILAKMAVCGGVSRSEDLSREEKDFLLEFVRKEDPKLDLDALIASVRDESIESLTATVGERKDGFFITMRAYFLAHSNHVYTNRQRELFERLVELFQISESDRRLIQKTHSAQRGSEPRAFESAPTAVALVPAASRVRDVPSASLGGSLA